jgi:hypothetical protein
MTIKEQLRECYETGKDIIFNLSKVENVILDDIFVIIHLVEKRICNLCFDHTIWNNTQFDNDAEYSHIIIPPMVKNVNNMILLLIINNDEYLNNLSILYENSRFEYEHNEKFVKLAIEFGVIDYYITRRIIWLLNMTYSPDPTMAEYNTKGYLGIVDSKSAKTV